MQRRAEDFVKNEYSITPGTVTKILNDLKWPTLEKRRKVAMMFKVISGLSAINPIFTLINHLKGDRALGNSTLRHSFKLVPKQTNTNTVLLHVQSETGTHYQIVSLKRHQWRILNWPSCAILKNPDPGTFFYLTLAP